MPDLVVLAIGLVLGACCLGAFLLYREARKQLGTFGAALSTLQNQISEVERLLKERAEESRIHDLEIGSLAMRVGVKRLGDG